jgi:hypothetical protein
VLRSDIICDESVLRKVMKFDVHFVKLRVGFDRHVAKLNLFCDTDSNTKFNLNPFFSFGIDISLSVVSHKYFIFSTYHSSFFYVRSSYISLHTLSHPFNRNISRY